MQCKQVKVGKSPLLPPNALIPQHAAEVQPMLAVAVLLFR
jgi:hypothetical protein